MTFKKWMQSLHSLHHAWNRKLKYKTTCSTNWFTAFYLVLWWYPFCMIEYMRMLEFRWWCIIISQISPADCLTIQVLCGCQPLWCLLVPTGLSIKFKCSAPHTTARTIPLIIILEPYSVLNCINSMYIWQQCITLYGTVLYFSAPESYTPIQQQAVREVLKIETFGHGRRLGPWLLWVANYLSIW